MKFPLVTLVAAVAALFAAAGPGLADAQADAEALFAAETVATRAAAIDALENADPRDPIVPYALGAGQFFAAVEGLGQALNRHGFEPPRSFLLPLLELPVPPRAEPEPLTYDGFRDILVAFRDGLQNAADTLDTVPADAEIGLVVDFGKFALDLDGDGTLSPAESLAAIIAALGPARAGPPAPLVFRFDRADGYWLQGYAELLTALVDFWLAHDFQNAFDASFQAVFPRAGLPLQEALVPPANLADPGLLLSEWRLADMVSFFHLINWQVIEPERRQTARLKLLEVIRLSRETWKAVLAETDNDREWLPGPQQKGVHPLTGLEVGEAQLAAWQRALQMAEDLLEGRVLLPHFRIAESGINMRAFFEAPQPFDLVLAITGPGVVPYLEKGTLLTAAEFDSLRQQFGTPGLLPFALWFN